MSGKDVIFILGSGRSGSSAITRVLSFCGCTLPQSVFGGTEENPRGYWEPADAAKLNLQFLLRHSTQLRDPTMRLQAKVECESVEREAYVKEIRLFLASCPDGAVLLIKEPLINMLIDFWFEAARIEGLGVKILIVLRHPNEVLASGSAFAAKLGFQAESMESKRIRWLSTNLATERSTRGFCRVFVEYSNLMNDWRSEIARAAKALSIDFRVDEAAIDRFLTRGLHRQRCAGAVEEEPGSTWCSQVYAILSNVARDGEMDISALDDIYRDFAVNERTLDELRRGVNLKPLLDYFEHRPVWRLGREF